MFRFTHFPIYFFTHTHTHIYIYNASFSSSFRADSWGAIMIDFTFSTQLNTPFTNGQPIHQFNLFACFLVGNATATYRITTYYRKAKYNCNRDIIYQEEMEKVRILIANRLH